MISFGFMVSFRLFDMLCMVTTLPVCERDVAFKYTLCGNAKRRAIEAKNISMQMMKFCQPAATVPALNEAPGCESNDLWYSWITPIFSSNASKTPKSGDKNLIYLWRYILLLDLNDLPCQNVKKITDLIVKNFRIGLYGLSMLFVAK